MAETKRRIEYMPLKAIKGAALNPKLHDVGALGQSLKRFGFTEAPTLDERTQRLVAGHGRIELLTALKARGKKPPDGVDVGKDGDWLVPVQRGWASKDDTEARAYVVASNKTSEAGGWDEDKLAAELAAIADDSVMALLGTGFDDDALAKLVGEDAGGGKRAGGSRTTQAVFQVLVEVDGEAAQAKLLTKLESEGYKCRPLLF